MKTFAPAVHIARVRACVRPTTQRQVNHGHHLELSCHHVPLHLVDPSSKCTASTPTITSTKDGVGTPSTELVYNVVRCQAENPLDGVHHLLS